MKGIHRESEICICGHSSVVHIVKCCVEKCKCKEFRKIMSKKELREKESYDNYEKLCNFIMKKEETKEDKNMSDKRVRIKVSGYIEMSQENLERLLEVYHKDAHMGLIYSIHMGYTDSSNLEFDIQE